MPKGTEEWFFVMGIAMAGIALLMSGLVVGMAMKANEKIEWVTECQKNPHSSLPTLHIRLYLPNGPSSLDRRLECGRSCGRSYPSFQPVWEIA